MTVRPHGDDTTLPLLPERAIDSHKGSFGLALLVGGSRGMAGAISLAGMAALGGGAGLVRLAVPDICLQTVAGFEPSYMTVALPSDPRGRISSEARHDIIHHAASATVVGCGPGMGRSLGLDVLVSWLYRHLAKPMVVDADGLNALASRPDVLPKPGGPRILTPHPGEFARLTRQGRAAADKWEAAATELSTKCGVVVVLKTHRTLVTDGERIVVNTTGNPGLATGGTGDVLTGLITSLACQGLAPYDAARLGVYLHGLSGDMAAGEMGQESMTARDLIRFLPDAFRDIVRGLRDHDYGNVRVPRSTGCGWEDVLLPPSG